MSSRAKWVVPLILCCFVIPAVMILTVFIHFREEKPRDLPIYSCGGATARTPKAAVRGYYAALSKHDFQVAARYVAPSNCRYFQTGMDEWDNWGNIKKLSNLRVAGPWKEHPGSLSDFESYLDDQSGSPRLDLATHDKWVSIRADFSLRHQYPFTPHDDGPTSQGILLGRSIKSGQWEIVDEPMV